MGEAFAPWRTPFLMGNWYFWFPSDICHLPSIDADEELHNNGGNLSFQELLKEDAVLDGIEGLGAVQEASIHKASIPYELVNGLIDNPAA